MGPGGYESEALAGMGPQPLGLGGMCWSLWDLGCVGRKPSGGRGFSFWNIGDTGFEPLGHWGPWFGAIGT